MISIRKIQMLAAAVIVNGALALTLMSPQGAQAASCSPVVMCGPALVCSVGPQACPSVAGCQVVSVSCGDTCGTWPIYQAYVSCNYVPL